MKAYQTLEGIFAKAHHVNNALAFLHWDYEVMMPQGGAASRAEQLAVLDGLHHQALTSKEIEPLLDHAEQEHLDPWQTRNLKLMRKIWLHHAAIPADLQHAFSKAGTTCNTAWRTAKESDDFDTYLPHQQEVVKLAREIAQAKAAIMGCTRYEAMLDQFDEGRKDAELQAIFSELKAFLPDFIQNVVDHQRTHSPVDEVHMFVPKEKLLQLNKTIMKTLGFNFNHGRLDSSTHPFCGGSSEDIRITTRYDDQDFLSSLMAVMHETGHALYEAGLNKDWATQPVGQALGMSVHESQALLIEMQLGRSREFLYVVASIISQILEENNDSWSATNLYKLYTRVEPGFIRVDADEVTYPVHVMIRYEIEKQLIEGAIDFKDVPELWHTQMKSLLGLEVPSHKLGCMQDIHWTDGSFGYFPSYTLGAIIAAQLFHSATKHIPDIKLQIKEGNITPLIDWLREQIHSNASSMPANDLLRQTTGESINIALYTSYLKNKYLY